MASQSKTEPVSHHVRFESQSHEASSDEQRLFLKVLEDLKYAVSKLDEEKSDLENEADKANSQDSQKSGISVTKQESLGSIVKLNFVRSEPEEPGTTSVTVSHKTKSLILKKLQEGNDKSQNCSSSNAQSSSCSMVDDLNISDQSNQMPVRYVSVSNMAKFLPVSTCSVSSGNTVVAIMGVNNIEKIVPNAKTVSSVTSLKNVNEAGHKQLSTSVSPTKPTEQLFPCNFCDYYSNNKNYLKQHLHLVHSNDRPFKCPYCDYAGKRSHALREHLIVHTDERPFQCQVCNATFRKKGHLTNHVKLHNSKRLVKCPLCKVLVYDSGENGLDAHLKKEHDTERLYGCDLCDHVAANEPDILKHLNEKHMSKLVIYKCDRCPFQSADSVAFRDHAKSHSLSDSLIQINNGGPVKVIGVAAVPKSEKLTDVSVANIKFSSSIHNGSSGQSLSAVSQPALVKPLFIKCSECGFVAQDSEVVKRHMLEHLKTQFGEEYVQQISKSFTKSSSQSSNTDLPSETLTPLPKAPILVPVTNSNQTMHRNVGNAKIDMNSPILVPVTDPSLLKTLQNAAVQGALTTVTSALQSASRPVVSTIVKAAQSSKGVVAKQPTSTDSDKIHSGLRVVPFAHSGGPVQTITALPISLDQVKQAQSSAINASRQLNISTTTIAPSQPGGSRTSDSSTVTTIASREGSDVVQDGSGSKIGGSTLTVPAKLPPENQKSPPPRLVFTDCVSSPSAKNTSHEVVSAIESSVPQKQSSVPLAKTPQTKVPEKNVVYYLDTTDKSVASSNPNTGFIHDRTAGRFRCTLCGYTCDSQRTVKAHIWRHTGNKNVNYPMFQNGPLSVYEDEQLPVCKNASGLDEVSRAVTELENSQQAEGASEKGPKQINFPSVVIYEKTPSFVSNVAPFLAKMIAKKTQCVSDSDTENNDTEQTTDQPFVEPMPEQVPSDEDKINYTVVLSDTNEIVCDEEEEEEERKLTIDESETLSGAIPVVQNVVVETVNNLESSSDSYTCMQSQQNSPRVCAHSPDSGLTEVTIATHSQDNSSSSGVFSSSEHAVENGRKRLHQFANGFLDSLAPKKARLEREDSAVTLLSLLKKGPNFNPACPQNQQSSSIPPSVNYSNASSPGHEDSNSFGESEVVVGMRKPGISTSLLAVIEQLRERSKSDLEEERPVQPLPKKQYKRRSRKNSLEDNSPASGIENVEEFVKAGEVKYRCKLCHYTSESTQFLRQHMKLHKPKQQFECSLCDLIAESSEALQDHMIQHCKVRKYQCKLCTSMFNYKSQLRAHMRMHNDQDIMMCDYCDFETRNSVTYKMHVKGHMSKPPYKCNLCNAEFTSSQEMRVHIREDCADKSFSPFKCNECEFTSYGRRELKNHQRIHMGKAIVLVPKRCPYCDYVDGTIEQIRKHISEVHGESKPLKCDMCGFVAVSIRSLKSHMKRHVNDQRFVAQPLEQYKCNLCGYVCHHLPSLKSHMWRHAPDLHYSYEFTNDVINAAIDFDCLKGVSDTNEDHVESFRNLIMEKMKVNGLDLTGQDLDESAKACCWVTFRCCQCGFETINKAELNLHMGEHTDVIKMTLEVADTGDSGRLSQEEEDLDE